MWKPAVRDLWMYTVKISKRYSILITIHREQHECICFTHIFPKRPRVGVWSAELFCHFLLFSFLACQVFLQSQSSELFDCVCVHWRTDRGTMQECSTNHSPLSVHFYCSPPLPFAPPSIPSPLMLLTIPSLPSPPPLCPLFTRSVKHKYHSLST